MSRKQLSGIGIILVGLVVVYLWLHNRDRAGGRSPLANGTGVWV